MKRTKFKFSILALALVFIFSVTALFAVNFINLKPASAAGTVSLSSSTFTKSGEASVVADKQETGKDDDGNAVYTYYSMFRFGFDTDNISFRRNLAYSWYEGIYDTITDESEDEDGETVTNEFKDLVSYSQGLFNMEIGFKRDKEDESGELLALPFKKFIITFESQQYSKTEDGKTVNYIIFFPAEDNEEVKVLITDDKEADDKDAVVLKRDHISIKFVEIDGHYHEGGVYNVVVSNSDIEDSVEVSGAFKNVGGNYAKYSSSSTTPVFPLIFNAEFEDGKIKEGEKTAKMILYSLNNQNFVVTGNLSGGGSEYADGEREYYSGGYVTDDTPAVLCLNKEISNLSIGGNISFDYQTIDVLRSTPGSGTLYYHVLKVDDLGKDTKYTYIDTNHEDDIFKKVGSNTLLDSSRADYLPELGADKDGGAGLGADFEIDMAVKVYIEIEDTSTNGEVSYVFLDWYLRKDLKINKDKTSFIAVGKDKNGVTFDYDGKDKKSWENSEKLIAEYKKSVDEAAKDLSAGSSSYFYVPSPEKLFAVNSTAYSDLKISLYYWSSSQSSNTSLASNNLSINVTKPDTYIFTLYATDAAGNNMYYYDGDELVEFKTSEIWDMYDDDDRHDYLPWFEFTVDYKGVKFKEVPGKQSTAYVGTTYTAASFDINGIDGSYTTKYRLFRFERAKYYKETNLSYSYESFIEVMDDLFENYRECFYEIKEVNESDEDYEIYKDYNWSSSSTSFTPQDGNAFYYIRAEVTDTQYNTDPVTCSLAVVASYEAKALKGDSEWLKNNVASVILLSVAGVSLIAIILLLVIKPKNKDDIDVQFEKVSKKKK